MVMECTQKKNTSTKGNGKTIQNMGMENNKSGGKGTKENSIKSHEKAMEYVSGAMALYTRASGWII